MTTSLRNDMRDLMKAAWVMVRKSGYTLSDALKASWRAFKLKSRMRKGQVSFAFRKANGEIRHALGTLVSEFLPKRDETKPTKSRTPQYSAMVYFDLDKSEYRSFTIANLI